MARGAPSASLRSHAEGSCRSVEPPVERPQARSAEQGGREKVHIHVTETATHQPTRPDECQHLYVRGGRDLRELRQQLENGVTCALPARRAGRTDPGLALRD